jgi:hypothetical protein
MEKSQNEAILIPLTHIYLTSHLPDFVQADHINNNKHVDGE